MWLWGGGFNPRSLNSPIALDSGESSTGHWPEAPGGMLDVEGEGLGDTIGALIIRIGFGGNDIIL